MIFKSPHADIAVPETHLTPLVLRRARALADKPALVDAPTGRALTYGQLAGQIYRAAAGLARRGYMKGDVFAVFSPNAPEYAVAFHAASLVGGVTTTVNPLSTVGEVAGQLSDARASCLITAPPLLQTALEAAAQTGVREVFVFGEAEGGAESFNALLEADGEPPRVNIEPRRDLAALPYSSGTTGFPKGVMLTHYNLVANLCQIGRVEPFREQDTLVCVVPFSHLYGLQVVLNGGLHKGATVVIMPRYDFEELLRVVRDYRVTRAPLVPPIVQSLAFDPLVDGYDLTSLERVYSGAAPLAESVARACTERLGCPVKYGYGQTEVSPLSHMSLETSDRNEAGAVGYLVPNTECKLIDYDTGAELGPGERGEIWTRGPQVMKGYLNNPEATAASIDAEGWLRTGDIGYADEGGHFCVVDRVKELIKYKGLQVAPAELEAVLLKHPAVADAAVVPVPDESAGEVPKAFVVLKGEAAGEQEIMEFVAARVAPHKKVRRVEFVAQIPRSPAGKILRRLLVERDRANQKA